MPIDDKDTATLDIQEMFIINNGVLKGYNGADVNVIIPDGVVEIRDAFKYSNIESVVIPEGVTTIAWSAFENCTNLKKVVLPDGLISINNDAFKNCSNLTEINLPDSIIRIGQSAFKNCPLVNFVNTSDETKSRLVYRRIFGYEGGDEVLPDWYEEFNKTVIEEENKQREQTHIDRKQRGVCQHCGGEFTGFIIKRCRDCGTTKDY